MLNELHIYIGEISSSPSFSQAQLKSKIQGCLYEPQLHLY